MIHVVLTVAQKGMQYIVVLLPNSELTKGNNKRDADGRAVCFSGRPWREQLLKLPITLLFVVRNIKYGYLFS